MNGTAKVTGAAKERCKLGLRLKQALDRDELPSWHDQVKLVGEVGLKSLQSWASELIAVVNEHLSCAAFQDDLRNFQQAIFGLAGRALDAFVNEKAAARVVDFGDMLAIADRILGRPNHGQSSTVLMPLHFECNLRLTTGCK